MQVLAKNMAAKKTPYSFVAGVTPLYVNSVAKSLNVFKMAELPELEVCISNNYFVFVHELLI